MITRRRRPIDMVRVGSYSGWMGANRRGRPGVFLSCIALAAIFACAASSASAQTAPSPSAAPPPGWPAYTNTRYEFAFSYPGDYGIVPERTAPESGADFRLRVQEKELLASDFVDREPARFMVEVFLLPQPVSLTSWLRSTNRLTPDAVSSPLALRGAQEGLRVQRRQQLAPNEISYFIKGNLVYALTPLGPQSAAILASFHFL
jgi:hypothetical protein